MMAVLSTGTSYIVGVGKNTARLLERISTLPHLQKFAVRVRILGAYIRTVDSVSRAGHIKHVLPVAARALVDFNLLGSPNKLKIKIALQFRSFSVFIKLQYIGLEIVARSNLYQLYPFADQATCSNTSNNYCEFFSFPHF